MSDNVINLNMVTKVNLPTDRILEAAKSEVGDHVMVIGWGHDDHLYFSSSVASGPECLWLLKLAERALIKIGSSEE